MPLALTTRTQRIPCSVKLWLGKLLHISLSCHALVPIGLIFVARNRKRVAIFVVFEE